MNLNVFLFCQNKFIILFVFQPEDNRVILGASKETGEEDWGHWTKANNSIIQQLFYGQQKSTVSCNTCTEKSVTFEPFSSLSLPLPSEGNTYTLSVSNFYYAKQFLNRL